MRLTATCSLVAPPSKRFAATVVILLLALNCAASGSSCSASSSDACSSDRSHPAFSTITCSTSEAPFAFGEKGTLNWDGWRCEACSVAAFSVRVQGAQGSGFRVCGCPCRALETPFCRQINSLGAHHRCCLIRDACVIDGQLVVFAPVDFVSDLFAGSGMFHIESLGAWSPLVLSSGIAALGLLQHQPTGPHPPRRASPPSSCYARCNFSCRSQFCRSWSRVG